MNENVIDNTIPLTLAEKKVMELAAQGLSNSEIANRLCVSINTVKTHLACIYSKYFVADKETAVMRVKVVLKYLERKNEIMNKKGEEFYKEINALRQTLEEGLKKIKVIENELC